MIIKSYKKSIAISLATFIISGIAGIYLMFDDNAREKFTKWNKGYMDQKQNYVVTGGKIMPLTKLTPSDANRPCIDCHKK